MAVLGAAAVAFLSVSPALAGNGMSSITVQVERLPNSAAVKAIVGGDDDSSSVLRMFGRWQGAGSYETLMVMVRRIGFGPTTGNQVLENQIAGNVFEGRIMLPQANRIAEWYIEATDAGGKIDYRSAGAPDTVSASAIRQTRTTGPVFFASQAAGDDNNAGSFAYPTRTVNRALQLLASSTNQGANGGVWVLPGEYHERLDISTTLFPTDGRRSSEPATDIGERFLSGLPGQRDT